MESDSRNGLMADYPKMRSTGQFSLDLIATRWHFGRANMRRESQKL
jgi:hypothetical protein